MIRIALALFTSLIFSMNGIAQEQTTCPSPLVTLTEADTSLITHTTQNRYIYYTVRTALNDGMGSGSDALYRIPIDGTSSPELLYESENYLFNQLFTEDNLIFRTEDELLRLELDAEPELSVIVADDNLLPNSNNTDSHLTYFIRDGDTVNLYHLDLETYETTLIKQFKTWTEDFNILIRYRETENYLVYASYDEQNNIGLYSFEFATGTITLLSDGVNIDRALQPGIYYTLFVTDDSVIFESRDEQNYSFLYSVPISGGEVTELVVTETDFVGDILLSPDEQHLIYQNSENGLALYSVSTDGSTPPNLIDSLHNMEYFDFGPGGNTIIYNKDGILYLVSLANGESQPLDTETTIGTNFGLFPIGDQNLIVSSFANGNTFTVYQQPADFSAPMQILFESEWDYTYGRYFLRVGDESIIYRHYNGETTRLFQQQISEAMTSAEQIACTIDGHIRLVNVIEDDESATLIYTIDDQALYAIDIPTP